MPDKKKFQITMKVHDHGNVGLAWRLAGAAKAFLANPSASAWVILEQEMFTYQADIKDPKGSK